MPDHDTFLRKLWDAFPGQVYLAGRYNNPQLNLPEDNVLRIFLPDFHWISARTMERYSKGWGFNGNLRLPPNNKPIFGTLLDVLEDIHDQDIPSDKTGLEVFHLGDAYDLWREMASNEKDATNAYERIRRDPSLEKLIERLDGLSIKHTLGNHDQWLDKLNMASLAGMPFPQVKAEWSTAGDRIIITHGHEFDSLEMGLPDDIQAAAVRLWTSLKAEKHSIGVFSKKAKASYPMVLKLRSHGLRKDFYPTVEPDGAYFIETAQDLATCDKSYETFLDVSSFSRESGSSNDFAHIDYLRYADEIAAAELNHPLDHSVHVIGHTHRARLLVDRINPNRPFVTFDCGGWIGLCKVLLKRKREAAYVPSAQVGVQSGNELRIYQLGGAG